MKNMDALKEDIHYINLTKKHKYLVDLLLESKCFKRELKYKTCKGDQINDVLPFPIFKISELPLEDKPKIWFIEEKRKYRIPTFIGKFKEIIFNVCLQIFLEDIDGKIIKILLNIDEHFEEIEKRLLELRYTVGEYVFVYDAYRTPIKETNNDYIIIDSLSKMSNERWINRRRTKQGVSAKYIPKIVFALILLGIAYYYDLK